MIDWLLEPNIQLDWSLAQSPPWQRWLILYVCFNNNPLNNFLSEKREGIHLDLIHIVKEKEKPKSHDHMTPLWGEEWCRLKAAKLWYYAVFHLFSIWWIIVKMFRILKLVCRDQCPLVGECGVTHQPQMLEPLLTSWHDWNEVNK